MDNKKRTIFGILITIAVISIACIIPEIISSDEAIATEVAEALDEALEETAAAEVDPTYTPYPTYTPVPTYTVQPNMYPFNQQAFPDNNNRMPPIQTR